MRYDIGFNQLVNFSLCLRNLRIPRFGLALLLLFGLISVSLADEEEEAPPLPEPIREALQVASDAIIAERNPLSAPYVIYAWQFHQDNWGTPAMGAEYGSFGIDNCVSAIPTMQKRSDVVFGWNFTIADMSCNVYYARVSSDRAHAVLCDEVAVSPNASPARGAGLAQVNLLVTVDRICGNVLEEIVATPEGEELPEDSARRQVAESIRQQRVQEGRAEPDDESSSDDNRSSDNQSSNNQPSNNQPTNNQPSPNQPRTNPDDTGSDDTNKPKCRGTRTQLGTRLTSQEPLGGAGDYRVERTTDEKGCVTIQVSHNTNPSDRGIEIIADPDCLKENVDDDMLKQFAASGTSPEYGDVFKMDC